MKTGVQLIAEERARQIEQEGFTPEHDKSHPYKALVRAAISYLYVAWGNTNYAVTIWPWDYKWYRPTFGIRDLIKAGALVAAAIDRLQAEEKENATTPKSKED